MNCSCPASYRSHHVNRSLCSYPSIVDFLCAISIYHFLACTSPCLLSSASWAWAYSSASCISSTVYIVREGREGGGGGGGGGSSLRQVLNRLMIYDVPPFSSSPSLGRSWVRIWLTSTFDLQLLGFWVAMNIINGIARGGSPCVQAPLIVSLAPEEQMLWEGSTCEGGVR